MAITVGNSATVISTRSAGSTPQDGSFDSGSGLSNAVLIVSVHYENGPSNDKTLDSITYNSVSMTLGKQQLANSGGNNDSTDIYYLVNPAEGSNTVSTVWTNAANDNELIVNAMILEGCDTSDPLGGTNGVTRTQFVGTTYNDTLTTDTDNSASVTAISTVSSAIPLDVVTGWTTEIETNNTATPDAGLCGILGYNTDQGTAGSQTISYSFDDTGITSRDQTAAHIEIHAAIDSPRVGIEVVRAAVAGVTH